MEIKERNINELISAEYNPRKLSQEQYNHLKDSLTRFGVVDPVIVNKHPDRLNIIVGGHQRCRVWQEMGNELIPTVEVDLTPEKERELNVRLNKNSGEFDFELLQEHFNTEDLVEWGFEDWHFPEDVDLDQFFEEDTNEQQSPKNKIVLEYSEQNFEIINKRFNELDGSKEQIVWKLLEL